MRGSIYGTHKVKKEEQTYALAKRLANTLEGGEVILLDGDLGAGKTTFTKGLAKALGVSEEVTSPTFTILNVYESGRLKLNHLDMYRIESEDEIAELGVEDCFDDDAVTVIEWNKFRSIDGNIITVSIVQNGDAREITISRKGIADDEKDGLPEIEDGEPDGEITLEQEETE